MRVRSGEAAQPPLPLGLTHSQSHRYQQLARIPEEHFERHVAECNAKLRSVSPVGLLAASRKWSTEGGRRRSQPEPKRKRRLTHDLRPVRDAVRRLMEVDVALGVAPSTVGAATQISGPAEAAKLHGRVAGIVAENPEKWLEVLADRTRIEEALLVLPAETSEPWVLHLAEDGWSCCFLVDASVRLVAYHGERKHGFWLAFRNLGAVLEAAQY